jgi:hypothetical protein
MADDLAADDLAVVTEALVSYARSIDRIQDWENPAAEHFEPAFDLEELAAILDGGLDRGDGLLTAAAWFLTVAAVLMVLGAERELLVSYARAIDRMVEAEDSAELFEPEHRAKLREAAGDEGAGA